MARRLSPMTQLLARVQTWCGISISAGGGITHIVLRDHPIARFPTPETLEVVLCGSIRDQVRRDPDDLPDGVWPLDDASRLIVDLTQPGGMEEAVRSLLNAYLLAEHPAARDWWLRPEHLAADPTCEKLAVEVEHFRQQARAVGA